MTQIRTSMSFDTQARLLASFLFVGFFTMIAICVENVRPSIRILTFATGFILTAAIWVFRGPKETPHD